MFEVFYSAREGSLKLLLVQLVNRGSTGHCVFSSPRPCRFPNLRFASIENGSDFLGPMFRKFDQTAKKSYWWFDNHPVDTFKQHVWVNPFWEDDVDEVVELMGADRVIFGSDWPHIEGMPQPLDYLVELKNLDAEQTKRVMLDNVLELNTPQPL